MKTVVKTLLVVLVAYLAGCCSQPEHPQITEDNLFITIEWYGAMTEPIREVAFANKKASFDLERWVAYNRYARTGAIITKEECSRVHGLLEMEKFAIRKMTTKPSADYQQYVLTLHSSTGNSYYPLGPATSTIDLLTVLRNVLNAQSAALLEPILK